MRVTGPNVVVSRYIGQGRADKAREILVTYHGDEDPTSVVAALELEEMLEVISVQGSDKRWWDFRELFNSRSARYRTFLITCIAFFGQWDLPPTSYYFPLMGELLSIASDIELTCVFESFSEDRWDHERTYPAPAERPPDSDHDGGRTIRLALDG